MGSSVDAILFDMDGTLVDSAKSVERSWSLIAGELALDTAAVLAVCHGRPAPDTLRAFCPEADDATIERLASRQLELQYTDLHDVVRMPGCQEVLDAVARHHLPWAIVTSADGPLADARLRHCGITPPAVLVTTDDIRRGKPDPEGYLIAAAALHVAIDRCIVVEDSSVGVDAGRRAGARVAALNGLDGDIPIASLHDLVTWLDFPAQRENTA